MFRYTSEYLGFSIMNLELVKNQLYNFNFIQFHDERHFLLG